MYKIYCIENVIIINKLYKICEYIDKSNIRIYISSIINNEILFLNFILFYFIF